MSIFSGENVRMQVTVPVEVYNSIKDSGGKISSTISTILTEWYLSTASNRPVMEVTPDVSESKPISLKDMIKGAVGACEIDLDAAKLMGGFKPFEVDKVYESIRKRTATSKGAVYKIMMDMIK